MKVVYCILLMILANNLFAQQFKTGQKFNLNLYSRDSLFLKDTMILFKNPSNSAHFTLEISNDTIASFECGPDTMEIENQETNEIQKFIMISSFDKKYIIKNDTILFYETDSEDRFEYLYKIREEFDRLILIRQNTASR